MAASLIHPTAIIDPSAEIASSVEVGPYAVIGPGVTIKADCVIGPHVVIRRWTEIGERNHIYQFASIGEDCQDKKYDGEPTRLIIGDDNNIREFTTLHRGTVQDNGQTMIGSRNLIMAYVHIGHDCIVGNDAIIANNTALAGHVVVGDGVLLGGFTAVHQYCQLGAYSMSAMCTAINKDVPAFVMVQGNLANARGMNVEGMRRRGYSADLIGLLLNAYKVVYRQQLSIEQAVEQLSCDAESLTLGSPELALFIRSLRDSKRGIVR